MKASLILAAILSLCASMAHAADRSQQAYVLHPSACSRCPQLIEVQPDAHAGVPKAGRLPAPIAGQHISGMPLGSVEQQVDALKYASISPAAEAELKRLGLVAVPRDMMERMFKAVDESIALNREHLGRASQ